MSGVNYGKTPEQAALELLTAVADPATHRQRLQEIKDAQDQASATLAEVQLHAAQAAADRTAADEAVANAVKIKSETDDKLAEITRRQTSWEANLNVRETELRKSEELHGKAKSEFEAFVAAKTDEIGRRDKALADKEEAAEQQRGELDNARAELDAKAKAIAEFSQQIR